MRLWLRQCARACQCACLFTFVCVCVCEWVRVGFGIGSAGWWHNGWNVAWVVKASEPASTSAPPSATATARQHLQRQVNFGFGYSGGYRVVTCTSLLARWMNCTEGRRNGAEQHHHHQGEELRDSYSNQHIRLILTSAVALPVCCHCCNPFDNVYLCTLGTGYICTHT